MDGSGASGGEGCLRPTPLFSFSEAGGVCFRTNERPRFNSEVRSAVSVAICTGSPADSSTFTAYPKRVRSAVSRQA